MWRFSARKPIQSFGFVGQSFMAVLRFLMALFIYSKWVVQENNNNSVRQLLTFVLMEVLASIVPLTDTRKKIRFIGWDNPYEQYITEVTIGLETYPVVEQGWVNTDWVVVEDAMNNLPGGTIMADI
jgi:cytosine/uracil/thiamine/allantoin permease